MIKVLAINCLYSGPITTISFLPQYFQILLIGENGKLPDYFIMTEWINIKNKINNEHDQVKKRKGEFSLSE
jgi:hypothetical protein